MSRIRPSLILGGRLGQQARKPERLPPGASRCHQRVKRKSWWSPHIRYKVEIPWLYLATILLLRRKTEPGLCPLLQSSMELSKGFCRRKTEHERDKRTTKRPGFSPEGKRAETITRRSPS